MSLPFDTTTLPEPTEEKIKILMAAIMQNGLVIQQLQLMVALRQKEIEEKKNRRQRERDEKEEEEKQTKLKEEEVRTMRTWSKEESRQYVERFRGYRGDKRCKRCSWFRHMAHQCRREEIEAERELRGGSCENRWELLRCRVMRCNEERKAVHSKRREAQQGMKCWECREVGHHLWTCPRKAARPPKGEVQQGKVVCRACKGENHIARNCNSYWRWRVQELRRKVKELKEQKKKTKEEERVVRCTMQPLKAVWMKIDLEKVNTHEGMTVDVLLDSGATGLFMNKKFMEKNGFRIEKLEKPVKVMNVDGTHNSGGDITHKVMCNTYYKGHRERAKFDVCNLGRTEVILGMPWLMAHNPEIDWENREVKLTRCPPWCGKSNGEKERTKQTERMRGMEEEKTISWAADKKEDWGREEEMEIDHHKIETIVPKQFHWWLKVFGKVELERMPVRKVWDHTIDVKDNFRLSKAKVYPLSRNEREKVQKFVNEHLRKGYIRPSKSEQTSPVFFVGKKDGGKRMVMDYRKLNRQTVKNNYPFPLITELVDNIGSKRVFTKMDLRWGYNNVHIKEGDEWKTAFTTYAGSFEPVVMFFGMTNSPATFQAMMNEILRDMINEGKVAAFIDDVLVGTETEEGHNEVVDEVLRRLEENDLYVKLEKCVWKVRKVPFLRVVMEERRVEMEEDKVKGVLKWPMPQCVRDVRKFLGLANYYRHFVKNFAKVALPMNRLTRKDEK